MTRPDTIGVQRKWIQGHPGLSIGKAARVSWIHFDISLGKRELAIAAGAVLTDKYGPSEHTARLKLEHPDRDARIRAQHTIDTIAEIRAKT